MKKDTILILSGGMDSTTMLYEYKQRIALAVSFDYGSNHNAREIKCAAEHCKLLNIEHLIIPLDFMAKYFSSSLLQGAEAIPEGDYRSDNMKSTVVPFRNGIMLSIAAGLAECRGLKHVMMANHGGDHDIYPDCRPEFATAMSEAIRTGTYPGITLLTPYTYLSKSDIAVHGKRLGLDYSKTYSCYKGGEKHCGKCGTCVERKQALKDAGITDTTDYIN
ncbi:MAG: 7-cyano-7-deazaguanine synthase QueC [Muribaculaceae bacterium]|nr:7-cyano-7-deazaguanine synthase QueC [Muribaculaceae bacterium]